MALADVVRLDLAVARLGEVVVVLRQVVRVVTSASWEGSSSRTDRLTSSSASRPNAVQTFADA